MPSGQGGISPNNPHGPLPAVPIGSTNGPPPSPRTSSSAVNPPKSTPPLPKTPDASNPQNPYGRIPKSPYGDLPTVPGTASNRLSSGAPQGASAAGIQGSLEKVTQAFNSADGFGAINAKFSNSEASLGNAMVNVMRNQTQVGKLGDRRDPDGPPWKAGMTSALTPYTDRLVQAFKTPDGRTTSADLVAGNMIDQVVGGAGGITTRPKMLMEAIQKTSTKLNEEKDPAKRQELVKTLRGNAQELVTNINGAKAKFEIGGTVMTDPKVLATLPEKTRNLTLQRGLDLLKLRDAFDEPGGIIQDALALGNQILASPPLPPTPQTSGGEFRANSANNNPPILPPLPPTPNPTPTGVRNQLPPLPSPPKDS